jgi:hypothetical protein
MEHSLKKYDIFFGKHARPITKIFHLICATFFNPELGPLQVLQIREGIKGK